MGLKTEEEKRVEEEEALLLARRIVLFNSEVIYCIKNRLMLMSQSLLNKLKIEHEKFVIIIKNNYKNVNIDHVLANVENNENHTVMKLEVDMIKDALLETKDDISD